MALNPALKKIDTFGVRVVDGVFSEAEVSALVQTVAAVPLYYINHSTTADTHELYGHWAYPLVDVDRRVPRDVSADLASLDETLDPIKLAWRETHKLLPSGSKTVNSYINGYTYGTDGYPHYEVLQSRAVEQRSILIYCCPRWEPAWGGETVFFDEDGEISAAILPKPGRVLVFRGDVLHVARAPSRFCPIERRVLVFKAWTKGIPTEPLAEFIRPEG
jgi:SM-20-related protein